MAKMFVRPKRDRLGNPCKVPKARLGVLRPSKAGEWPEGAVKPDGEQLPSSPYLKRLVIKGDLELVPEVREPKRAVVENVGTEPAEVSGEKPAGRRRKSAPVEE